MPLTRCSSAAASTSLGLFCWSLSLSGWSFFSCCFGCWGFFGYWSLCLDCYLCCWCFFGSLGCWSLDCCLFCCRCVFDGNLSHLRHSCLYDNLNLWLENGLLRAVNNESFFRCGNLNLALDVLLALGGLVVTGQLEKCENLLGWLCANADPVLRTL